MVTRVNINDNHLGCFNTAHGMVFNLVAPQPDMINPKDIITGLSNYCRFGGQMPSFYSVAQHSVLVAILAPEELRKAALLHDASEAYLGDVIKPLKVILGDPYYNLEQTVMDVICDKYGVTDQELEAVKEFDKAAVMLEDSALRLDDEHAIQEWTNTWQQMYGLYPGCWTPKLAMHIYGWWLKDVGVK